jgi:hypothetical protein
MKASPGDPLREENRWQRPKRVPGAAYDGAKARTVTRREHAVLDIEGIVAFEWPGRGCKDDVNQPTIAFDRQGQQLVALVPLQKRRALVSLVEALAVDCNNAVGCAQTCLGGLRSCIDPSHAQHLLLCKRKAQISAALQVADNRGLSAHRNGRNQNEVQSHCSHGHRFGLPLQGSGITHL